jgi:nitroimidazol reductase NimA-like FMN-containing flavoprotein (pyridoxamine 5'-phosphate oxidase superfamily)
MVRTACLTRYEPGWMMRTTKQTICTYSYGYRSVRLQGCAVAVATRVFMQVARKRTEEWRRSGREARGTPWLMALSSLSI